jgi:hypothetical protein
LDPDVAVLYGTSAKGGVFGKRIGQSDAPGPQGDTSFVAGKGGGTSASGFEGGVTAGFPQHSGRTPGPAVKGCDSPDSSTGLPANPATGNHTCHHEVEVSITDPDGILAYAGSRVGIDATAKGDSRTGAPNPAA